MSREHVLLTGGSGTLGTALQEAGNSYLQYDFSSPPSKVADIKEFESLRKFIVENKAPDIIIHAAALTNWETCHQNQSLAFAVNIIGTLNILNVAKESGARFVYISTDAVFGDGGRKKPYTEKNTPHNPVSIYGLTKLMSEMIVQHSQADALIVRFGWLFGPNPRKDVKFVGAILRQIAQGKDVIKAVTDKRGSLIYAEDASRKILDLISAEVKGVRHVVNSGDASRYEVAKEIIKIWELNARAEPTTSGEFPSVVKRPDYSVLKSVYSDSRLRSWQEALRSYHQNYPAVSDFAEGVQP